VLSIDRSARTEVTASPERCLRLLADVERLPEWSGLIAAVEVLERHPDGTAARVRLRAQVLGLPVMMDCELEIDGAIVLLRRLPYDADDRERYEARWTVSDTGAVSLQVEAALDAPGPAALLRGRVERRLVDDVLADFAAAVSER
jgi:hypothetical protein